MTDEKTTPTDTHEFLCGRLRHATQELIDGNWGGIKGRFQCFLCGHKFEVGDPVRFYCGQPANAFICGDCDGPNETVAQMLRDIIAKYRWLSDD